jgi:hypothetical protein
MNNETKPQPPIHASLEQAQKLKNAGWKKKTYFAYEPYTCMVRYDIDYSKDNTLIALPTLIEIELPEMVCVMLEFGSYKVTSSDFAIRQKLALCIPNGNRFATELEARIEAWIYFNTKKEVQDA